jgi:hypothetical protein
MPMLLRHASKFTRTGLWHAANRQVPCSATSRPRRSLFFTARAPPRSLPAAPAYPSSQSTCEERGHAALWTSLHAPYV